MKCPCEKCICIPICHQKYYKDLVVECSLLEKFLYGKNGNYLQGVINSRYPKFVERQNIAASIIKSKKWGPHYEVSM